MFDYKQRYYQLAKLTEKLCTTPISSCDIALRQMAYHIKETERLALLDEGKVKYLRLKQDVEINERYDHGGIGPTRKFTAGTLIQADWHPQGASVYLDNDGDGYLDFPANVLEEVIIPIEETNGDNVIYQG